MRKTYRKGVVRFLKTLREHHYTIVLTSPDGEQTTYCVGAENKKEARKEVAKMYRENTGPVSAGFSHGDDYGGIAVRNRSENMCDTVYIVQMLDPRVGWLSKWVNVYETENLLDAQDAFDILVKKGRETDSPLRHQLVQTELVTEVIQDDTEER